jgi:hypothetical protein
MVADHYSRPRSSQNRPLHIVGRCDTGLDRMVAVKMLLRGALGPLSNDMQDRYREQALLRCQRSAPEEARDDLHDE